jgi:hypothetical protein
VDFPGAGDVFSLFTAVFLSCHLLYFYFAKNNIISAVSGFVNILSNLGSNSSSSSTIWVDFFDSIYGSYLSNSGQYNEGTQFLSYFNSAGMFEYNDNNPWLESKSSANIEISHFATADLKIESLYASKINHTKRDSGLIDVPDEEISRRARDKSLTSQERQRYIKEEKVRGLRNIQKRKNIERLEEVTGLAGGALIIYIIVSEGSRLFPPRNLIPIP